MPTPNSATPGQENPAPAEMPVQQPVMAITSATALADKFATRFPDLNEVRPQLNLITALYSNVIQNPLGTPTLKEALADLDLYDTDMEGVQSALNALVKADNKVATEFADAFLERTERKLNVRTLNFSDAVKEETAEDQDQARKARILSDTALKIIAELGVANLHQPTKEQKPKRGSLLVGLLNAVGEKIPGGGGSSKKQVEEEPVADWLTPLVLDDQEEEYESLLKFMGRVQNQMNKYSAQPNMRTLVLDVLANAGITQSDIEERLARALELANEALAQTNAILALVGKDQQAFANWVDGLVDFRHMYGSVGKLFQI